MRSQGKVLFKNTFLRVGERGILFGSVFLRTSQGRISFVDTFLRVGQK